ncbi:MAG: prepilin-type N-terminal cleavage/methylation domain-containing protein, partial [Chloroflexota bacterium]|nr:prepilin-type N-terminal cleavage/methylation domain-containing protein [Chloroflexota bacterium]
MGFMRRIQNAADHALRRVANSGEGFTLIELIVVIAILGILIAIAIPTIRGFLESSREQAYEADRRIIQLAVDAYYYSPSNERVDNKRQYPIMGRRHTIEDKPLWDTKARSYLDKCGGNSADDPI